MTRELTPWERLDGVKHSLNFTNVALDSIIEDAVEWERSRIIKLLEIGGPIEQIICDYWGNPEFDKDDALLLIERAIKGEK